MYNFPLWVIYPSIFKPEDTRLAQRFKQSVEPGRAELYLFGLENEKTDLLIQEQIRDAGIKFDVDLDKGQQNIDQTMARRVKAGVKEQPAYLLEGQFTDSPVSSNPDDFKTFDLEAYLDAGGRPMRELWISNEMSPGLFGYGIDATAHNINGSGNPRANPTMLTDFISDTPGENGAIVFADKFGFRVPPGTAGADRYQCIFLPESHGGWAFLLINPVDPNAPALAATSTTAAATKPAKPTKPTKSAKKGK